MKQVCKSILVVDDEETALVALSKILTHDGYDVLSARNGQEALNYLRNKDVDLIITDMSRHAPLSVRARTWQYLQESGYEHASDPVFLVTVEEKPVVPYAHDGW
jgi:CheY-like chemotaxis protein